MSPRAWRWNSETPSSGSRADTCRDTADCERPSCSPACVKLPASAAAWKTLSLSQSMLMCALEPLLRRDRRPRSPRKGEEAAGFDRCHAPLPRSGHRLAVKIVGDVAAANTPGTEVAV